MGFIKTFIHQQERYFQNITKITQLILLSLILFKASPKNAYFNLETLCESVSQKEGIDKEEIKRLIVARVKETFCFRKAPTIDFIRLVNNFLAKQEVSNEETNI